MSIHIRLATDADFPGLESIERRADAPLVDYLDALDWPPATPAAERAAASGFALVAEDLHTNEPVGFVHVLHVGPGAHLEQISVLPEHGRRGIGAALLEAAAAEASRRGYTELTLRTYADVPWNAPFYAKHEYAESAPSTDFQRRLIATEERLGLMQYGPRVQMRRPL